VSSVHGHVSVEESTESDSQRTGRSRRDVVESVIENSPNQSRRAHGSVGYGISVGSSSDRRYTHALCLSVPAIDVRSQRLPIRSTFDESGDDTERVAHIEFPSDVTVYANSLPCASVRFGGSST